MKDPKSGKIKAEFIRTQSFDKSVIQKRKLSSSSIVEIDDYDDLGNNRRAINSSSKKVFFCYFII